MFCSSCFLLWNCFRIVFSIENCFLWIYQPIVPVFSSFKKEFRNEFLAFKVEDDLTMVFVYCDTFLKWNFLLFTTIPSNFYIDNSVFTFQLQFHFQSCSISSFYTFSSLDGLCSSFIVYRFKNFTVSFQFLLFTFLHFTFLPSIFPLDA